VQTTALPDERSGNSGFQYVCVVRAGFIEIVDEYIDVAEFQFYCMPPSEPASMIITVSSEFEGGS